MLDEHMVATAMAAAACLLACVGVAAAAGATPEDTLIRSGVPWFDTDGNRMYAGGANLYVENGTYYMVGEGRKAYLDLSSQFSLYSSPDLATWTYHGPALTNTSILAPQPGPYRMERPKLFKCANTSKYVLWFHCDTAPFSMQSVGVAEADTPTGPFTMTSQCFQPNGNRSYDMGMYVDGRGAFLVYSADNEYAAISQLSDDCRTPNGILSVGPRIEGPTIFHEGRHFYLLGSHLSGWAPNPASLSMSNGTRLNGNSLINTTWQSLGNPSNDSTTFDSQSTYVYAYVHPTTQDVTYLYMGDRWNAAGPGGLQNSTFVWLPLQKVNGSWAILYYDEWSFSQFCGNERCNATRPEAA